jgi:hypothetical protein
MLLLAFFATLVILRETRTPGARQPSGIILMAFGIWMLWAGAVRHHSQFYPLDSMPRITSLLLGAWLVVKGALRFSAN